MASSSVSAAAEPTRPRCALVTGASQGIGLCISLRLLKEGYTVVLVSRNIEKARPHIPPECVLPSGKALLPSGEGAGRAHLLSKDLSTEDGCRECVSEALQLLGGSLDVLVNNAGSGAVGKGILTTTAEDWDSTFDINLKSFMFLTQAAVEVLKCDGGGSIVNISGVAAQRPFTSMLPYCCAKAGVEMLTKCCALELAPQGIRVNSVAPGTISTAFMASAGLGGDGVDTFLAESASCHPVGRIGQAEDVAEAVLFLASPASSGFITGQSLMLDGGRTLTLPSGRALKTT